MYVCMYVCMHICMYKLVSYVFLLNHQSNQIWYMIIPFVL